MGESFEYDICYLRTRCKNQDGRIRFLENTKIEPSKQMLKGLGVLGRYSTVGTIYILVASTTVAQLQDAISKCTIDEAKVSVGTSILPDESGMIVRILAGQTEEVFDVIFNILQICRKKILGAPFTRTRKS
jgi:urease accessory protein